MESESNDTLLDKMLRWTKNNRILSVGLFAAMALIGFASLTDAFNKTCNFIDQHVVGITPTNRAEYSELLRPLEVELNRTWAAFKRWNKKDLSLESETIRDGNTKARSLLREKAELVPDALREDQQKLIAHYDKWLEEFDRFRVRKTEGKDPPFIFTYDFPKESEQRFKNRMADLEAKLDAKWRCPGRGLENG